MRMFFNTLVACVVLVSTSACNDSNSAKKESPKQAVERGIFLDKTDTGGSDTTVASTGNDTKTAGTAINDTTVVVTETTDAKAGGTDTKAGGTNESDRMAGGASAGGVMVGETDEAQVQLGPRPFYLVDDMSEGSLKTKLKSCEKGPFKRTDFSISHRGAPLQYADHTEVGYEAAIKMGAGIIECDVTVTKDNQLVCRHGDCDLAETTDILTRPELARKCTGQFKPFVPAHFDWLGFHGAVDATAKCCTTDFTLAELKTLRGKVDRGFNKSASTAQLYPMSEAAGYAQMGHVMSHADSIALFKKNGVKMIPEVKSASAFPKGLDHDGFRKLLIKAYVDAKVDPSDVFIQTFNKNDVLYLNKNEPAFAKNAALLMYGVEKKSKDDANKYMQDLYDEGIRTVAVFYPDLVSKDKDGKYSATKTLLAATKAKLDVIAWTVEYQTPSRGGDEIYNTLDVLAKNGAKGVFSNWPETVSYYASCMGLK